MIPDNDDYKSLKMTMMRELLFTNVMNKLGDINKLVGRRASWVVNPVMMMMTMMVMVAMMMMMMEHLGRVGEKGTGESSSWWAKLPHSTPEVYLKIITIINDTDKLVQNLVFLQNVPDMRVF